MGIKDNFSQAVKELLKKDDLIGEPAKDDGGTDLNRYLRETTSDSPPPAQSVFSESTSEP